MSCFLKKQVMKRGFMARQVRVVSTRPRVVHPSIQDLIGELLGIEILEASDADLSSLERTLIRAFAEQDQIPNCASEFVYCVLSNTLRYIQEHNLGYTKFTHYSWRDESGEQHCGLGFDIHLEHPYPNCSYSLCPMGRNEKAVELSLKVEMDSCDFRPVHRDAVEPVVTALLIIGKLLAVVPD